MTAMTLYIGDKNLSSWSLRAWLVLKQAGAAFREEVIRLDRPDSRDALRRVSPSGLVPCLVHGDVRLWDSLAIAEYANELFPEKALWPADRAARALARAISAEMHSGFAELRRFWPMNFARRDMRHLCPPPVRRDIDRIAAIWTECREKHGAAGPFLFGAFSIADAMYAPVVSRFMTYGPVELPPRAAEYARAIFDLPAMREWGEAAKAEVDAAP
ncbi:MAG: glutathione S-transferase family protein [Amphiplicatus sp.]|jgi:glutathione S-transferase